MFTRDWDNNVTEWDIPHHCISVGLHDDDSMSAHCHKPDPVLICALNVARAYGPNNLSINNL